VLDEKLGMERRTAEIDRRQFDNEKAIDHG
jgi:hypothetical protein